MRTIRLTDDQLAEAHHGTFGTYFRVSKTRGLKVLHKTSIKKLKKEFGYLTLGYEAGVAPKPFGIVRVETFGGYPIEYGILMQHIEKGRDIKSMNGEQIDELGDYVNKKLSEFSIQHNDLHASNLIIEYTSKRIIAIDWGPNGIRKSKYKKLDYTFE